MGKWPALDKVEMIDGPIDEKSYERELKELQERLLALQIHHNKTGGRVIIGIDGWDAAGKGGLIERIVGHLEPKSVHVWRISAPIWALPSAWLVAILPKSMLSCRDAAPL